MKGASSSNAAEFQSLRQWLTSSEPMTADPGPLTVQEWYNGKYQIEEFLGGRSNCSVFRAIDVALGRSVALKVWHGRNYPFESHVLQKEARYLARVDHPNLVRVLDFGRDPETSVPWMALEYLGRTTLRSLLRSGESLAQRWPLFADITLDMTSAVSYLHNIAHIFQLDIKPENFACDLSTNRVRMMDLGSATDWDATESDRFASPGYIAPELFSSEAVTEKVDIFALGVVFLEMLTLSNPFLSLQLQLMDEGEPEVVSEAITTAMPPRTSALDRIRYEAHTKGALFPRDPFLGARTSDSPTAMVLIRADPFVAAIRDLFAQVQVVPGLLAKQTPSELVELIASMLDPNPARRPDIDGVRTVLVNLKAAAVRTRRPSVFISHSHLDKQRFVTPFAERLKQEGFRVWLDEWSLRVGEPFWDRIAEAIQSSDYVVLVISCNSIESKAVREEIRTAQVENMARVKILPIRIDPIEYALIPPFVRSRQVFDFVGWDKTPVTFRQRTSRFVSQLLDLSTADVGMAEGEQEVRNQDGQKDEPSFRVAWRVFRQAMGQWAHGLKERDR